MAYVMGNSLAIYSLVTYIEICKNVGCKYQGASYKEGKVSR